MSGRPFPLTIRETTMTNDLTHYAAIQRALNPATAAKELARASADIAFMRGTFSGCDWCCGGGQESYDAAREIRDIAHRTLTEAMTRPVEWCICCGHYQTSTGVCDKCSTHPELSA